MTMPLDTLKLARRLEGAGFSSAQAGDMAEAFAEPLANFATKQDLKNEIEWLRRDLTIRIGGMMIVAVTIMIAATGALVRFVH